MKTKMFVLTVVSFLIALTGCQSPKQTSDPASPIETQNSRSAIHGDVGVEMESRSMNGIVPTRPNY